MTGLAILAEMDSLEGNFFLQAIFDCKPFLYQNQNEKSCITYRSSSYSLFKQ